MIPSLNVVAGFYSHILNDGERLDTDRDVTSKQESQTHKQTGSRSEVIWPAKCIKYLFIHKCISIF